MAEQTDVLAKPLPKPVEPQGKGRIGFKEAMGINEPFMTRKAEIQPEISKAEGDIAKAQQEQKEIKSTGELSAQMRFGQQQEAAMQGYQEKLEKEPLPAFIPSKDNAQDIAGLFGVISVISMLVGGGGRMSGQLALGNMNGMMEGYRKGRKDLYERERSEFDKNFKSMIQKHAEFRQEMEDAIKLAVTNKEEGFRAAELAATKAGSDIVKAQLRKGDLLGAYKLVDESQKGSEHALNMEQKARAEEARAKEAADRAREAAKLRKSLAEMKAGGGTSPAGANVTNDIESSAQAIANYAQKPPGLRDKTRSQIMARVRQINPSYNEMDYGQRDLAMRNYTNPNGAGAKQLQAFTTVAGHLNSLERLGEALNNKDTQLANQALNYIAVQTGNPEVTNFNAAKQAVAGEVVKAITGTAGALADRKEAEQIFSEIKSPEQLQGAIDTVKELIYSRLDTTRAHYESATGRHDFETRLPDIVKQAFIEKKRPSSAPASSAGTSSGALTPEEQAELKALKAKHGR